MKKVIVLLILSVSFMNCEKDELNDTKQSITKTEVIGTWEMYRDENLMTVIDHWTGTEWTTKDEWFQNTRQDSQIILEFKADNTFVDRYADVEVANGTWALMDDGRYYFEYIQDESSINQKLTQKRYITMHCDNTYSLEIEDNESAIFYYKKIGTTECSSLIEYNVE